MILRIGWAPVVALLAVQAAHAQPVSYEEALRAARQDQAILQAGELRVDGAREVADAAAELPDPRLRGGVMNFPFTGPAAFETGRQMPTQLSIGVEQDIPNLAKRHARSGIANTDIRRAQARLGIAERDIDVAVGTAWLALHFAQRRLDLARSALSELQGFVPVANSAVASGSARPAESLAVRREILAIEDAITAIETDRETAQARLARYISLAKPVANGVAPAAEVYQPELREALEGNPELLLSDVARERAEAEIRLARADKRPDFGVNVSYGRRNPDFGDVVSVMGSVTLPIFAGRRQNPRIAAAEAEASAVRLEREDQLRELTAQLETDLAIWRGALRQWQRAQEQLLPLARDRASLETASYAAGRADLIDVISAKSALAFFELEILEREEAAVSAAVTLQLTYGERP